MSKELKRMQELAGVPVKKESLNEHQIGGVVSVGAITQIPPREKTDYEMAFEHFIGEGYNNEYGVDIEEEKKEEPVEEGLKLDPNMTIEEFMGKLLGPDYKKKPQEKRVRKEDWHTLDSDDLRFLQARCVINAFDVPTIVARIDELSARGH